MAKKTVVLLKDFPIGNFLAKTNDQYLLDADLADRLVKESAARIATSDDLKKFSKSTLDPTPTH